MLAVPGLVASASKVFALFATLPLVEMVASLVFAIAAKLFISAFTITPLAILVLLIALIISLLKLSVKVAELLVMFLVMFSIRLPVTFPISGPLTWLHFGLI